MARRSITTTRGGWIAAGIALGMTGGCLQLDPFQCQTNADCIFQGRPGQCVLAEQICVYPDPACDTQWSTAAGECMTGLGSPEASGSSDAVPGDTGASSVASDGVDDTSTTAPTTTGPTTTSPPDTTGDPVGCGDGPFDDVVGLGVVEASSIFSDNFHAYLAADDDLGSSWFSSGPESGRPSVFRWTVLEPHCIATVAVLGNGLHDNPAFREDFGFESIVMRVYDQDDAIVFQQMASLAGTPDPDVHFEPGVWGVRVELELSEHESDNCGGFSELEITGL